MEPTIYKPSIYKGAGIYKTGAEGGGTPEYIGIGEFNYKVVQIDDLLWTAEDLKSILPGITFPNTLKWSTSPGCVIYDNDTTTYGIYGQNRGLLYNAACRSIIQNYLDEHLSGWRIPQLTDFQKLVNYCGGSVLAFNKLCAPRLWYSLTDITNEFGFNAIPTGRVSAGNFDDNDSAFYMTNNSGSPFDIPYVFCKSGTKGFDASGNANMSTNYYYSAIRLCKDA